MLTIESWLEAAVADAKRRGLAPLVPLLETLARSTAALRAADLALRGSTERTDVPAASTDGDAGGGSTR